MGFGEAISVVSAGPVMGVFVSIGAARKHPDSCIPIWFANSAACKSKSSNLSAVSGNGLGIDGFVNVDIGGGIEDARHAARPSCMYPHSGQQGMNVCITFPFQKTIKEFDVV